MIHYGVAKDPCLLFKLTLELWKLNEAKINGDVGGNNSVCSSGEADHTDLMIVCGVDEICYEEKETCKRVHNCLMIRFHWREASGSYTVQCAL